MLTEISETKINFAWLSELNSLKNILCFLRERIESAWILVTRICCVLT